MNWRNNFIEINPNSRCGETLHDVKKIVIHYTANPGMSAAEHQIYFNNLKDRYASAHLFIDKTEAICILPLNEVAYHANDVRKYNSDGTIYRGVKELLPNANYLSIGVELCIEYDGTFHVDTMEHAVDVVTDLCKQFDLNANDIVRHYDVTGKYCPAIFVDNIEAFHLFKRLVANKLL